MDNIVYENTFPVGTIGHLDMLLSLAERKAMAQGTPFKSEDYKWVLGVNVINELSKSCHYSCAVYPDRPMELFGIVAERDCYNPDNVQLWENITNKV